MTVQRSTTIPSQSSVPRLRIAGWAGVALSLALLAEVIDLSDRGHGPAVILWVLALTATGILGVSVGFTAIRPTTGGFGSRMRQQPTRYKIASVLAMLALAADLALCFVTTTHLG